MDYIENINAKNYLRGLKEVRPAMKVKRSNQVEGIFFLGIALVVGVMAAMDIIDGGFNFFGIIWTVFLGIFGAISMYMSKMHIRHVDAFIGKLEDDINNVNLETKRIRVATSGCGHMCGKFDREKRKAVNSNFSDMIIKDLNREIYRYNGILLEFSPFEYGMELEITYYANTRVINSVQVIEQ